MLLLAWTLCYAGFTALCLAMGRHRRQLWHAIAAPPAVLALRIGGYSLLVLGLVACCASFPGSLGFVVWLGLLTAAATPLSLALPFAPRAAVTAAVCAPFAAAVVVLAGA
jgi:hypothetical protein